FTHARKSENPPNRNQDSFKGRPVDSGLGGPVGSREFRPARCAAQTSSAYRDDHSWCFKRPDQHDLSHFIIEEASLAGTLPLERITALA
ncbi:hypothetical protein, partial [Cryobacterium sp. Y62]|uniref:hypothetical protein n=1 Tax=Cryobacterium sp. Y62 TaxID=2048284 RepID=UPI001E3D42C2